MSTFGNDFLKRTKNGAIVIAGADGKEQLLVPAECGASLLHADVERKSVIVSCGGDLWLFRFDGGYDLGKGAGGGDDALPFQSARRIVTICGYSIDMDLARIVPSPPLTKGEVRRITDSELRRQGVLAERGDGKVLRLNGVDERGHHVERGPLRWGAP